MDVACKRSSAGLHSNPNAFAIEMALENPTIAAPQTALHATAILPTKHRKPTDTPALEIGSCTLAHF
jgi:hypothetical protein